MNLNKSNLARVKNILSGKFTEKTKKYISITDKQIDHKEGDVWTENGKEWTIKEGIKQSISKLDIIRHKLTLPFCCPVCNKPMKKNIRNEKMYSLKNKCFDCVIQEDTDKIIANTFKQYETEKVNQNQTHYLIDLKDELIHFVGQIDNKSYITGDGIIEDWNSEVDSNRIKEITNNQIDKLNTIIDEKNKLDK